MKSFLIVGIFMVSVYVLAIVCVMLKRRYIINNIVCRTYKEACDIALDKGGNVHSFRYGWSQSVSTVQRMIWGA